MSSENTAPEQSGNLSVNADQTIEVRPAPRRVVRLKRGRHPAPTPGAFGGKRKDNGINYRTSSLIRAFR
jgi:hypothetical protein